MNNTIVLGVVLGAAAIGTGCGGGKAHFAATETSLKLSRVVLYRNGVGYFERAGTLSGQVLSLRCRKDQINDVLKSLTVVDRKSGQALSVSMPLDPQRFAAAATSILTPGHGNLAKVLDSLRGTPVDLYTGSTTVSGRVLLVEEVPGGKDTPADQRVSVLDGERLRVALLSRVTGLRFRDGDVAVQLNRSLDATAGEGMFKQVAISVRLSGSPDHDLALSYVVSAPVWQPTYRIVLPEDGKGDALLQGWAVVGNTSGEDWAEVRLSLTSGAPIAFRYDLHTPREVERQDVTSRALARQAQVALGETSYEQDEPAAPAMNGPGAAPSGAAPSPAPDYRFERERPSRAKKMAPPKGGGAGRGMASRGSKSKSMDDFDSLLGGAADAGPPPAPPPPPPPSAVDLSQLQRSTQTSVQAKRVSGLTQFDLQKQVTVPDGTATMVAVLNQTVPTEQTFLYKPGGGGAGYEANPYRVVRFKNNTPFVLEPGPISIYSGGSFVGEGISEAIAADTSATIPFAVEPSVIVQSSVSAQSGEVRLVRITGGTLLLENFQRHLTRWTVRGTKQERPYRVLVRQARAASTYVLKNRPADTEDLPDGYLIPVPVAAGKTEGSLEVVEQTPTRRSITIWDSQAEKALTGVLALSSLDAKLRARIQPIVELRHEIAQIDTQLVGLRQQQQALDQRAAETRSSLEAISKDKRAADLRQRLSQRLEEFAKEGDSLGRRLVELTSQRLTKKISLDELLQNLDLEAPAQPLD